MAGETSSDTAAAAALGTLRPLRGLADQPLNWVAVGPVRHGFEWDLRVGGGDSRAGWLRWAGGNAAEGRSAAGAFRFRRAGWWTARVEIEGPPLLDAAFRYERPDWPASWLPALVAAPAGEGALSAAPATPPFWWRRADRSPLVARAEWAWERPYGTPLVRVVHPRQVVRNRRSVDMDVLGRLSGRVEVGEAALETREALDLLVLLGWFLRLTTAADLVDY